MEIGNIVEICIALDIAILALAFPLLISEVNKIGEKFNSVYLIELFEFEWLNKKIFNNKVTRFKLLLYFTTFSFISKILILPPLFKTNIELIDYPIRNSADLLIISSTILLVIALFFWVERILFYSSNIKNLIANLRKYESKYRNLETNYYLKTMNELTLFVVKNELTHIQESLADFYYEQFLEDYKRNLNNKEFKLRIELIDFNTSVIESVIKIKNPKLNEVEYRAVSGAWLINTHRGKNISEKTYADIWKNLIRISDNTAFAKAFWRNSYNYYSNYYLFNMNTNDGEIDEFERKQFFNFHIIWLSYIYHIQDKKLLNYILNYSNQVPKRNILIPESSNAIYSIFIKYDSAFNGSLDFNPIGIYFPDYDNLGSEDMILQTLLEFLCILYIRIKVTNINNYVDSYIDPPTDYEGIKEWLSHLDRFQGTLRYVIETQKYFIVSEEATIINGYKESWIKEIDELKNNLIESKIHKITHSELSPDKIAKFKDSILEYISKSINDLNNNFSNKEIEETGLITSFVGISNKISKLQFTDYEDYLNYDSVVGGFLDRSIKNNFSQSFHQAITKTYSVKSENIIESINKIVADKLDDFIIIIFNPSFYSTKEIESKGVKFETINNSFNDMSNRIIIVNRNNLPNFKFFEVPELIEDGFEKIDDRKNNIQVYFKFDDKDEPENPEDMYIYVRFLAKIIWKSNIDLVQLKVISPYEESGIENKLSDIEPI